MRRTSQKCPNHETHLITGAAGQADRELGAGVSHTGDSPRAVKGLGALVDPIPLSLRRDTQSPPEHLILHQKLTAGGDSGDSQGNQACRGRIPFWKTGSHFPNAGGPLPPGQWSMALAQGKMVRDSWTKWFEGHVLPAVDKTVPLSLLINTYCRYLYILVRTLFGSSYSLISNKCFLPLTLKDFLFLD